MVSSNTNNLCSARIMQARNLANMAIKWLTKTDSQTIIAKISIFQ